MYDRGSFEQLWNAHAFVKPEVDAAGSAQYRRYPRSRDGGHRGFRSARAFGDKLTWQNFHRVLLAPSTPSFMIVDRKVALINSNNIQDRPNLESCLTWKAPSSTHSTRSPCTRGYNRLDAAFAVYDETL